MASPARKRCTCCKRKYPLTDKYWGKKQRRKERNQSLAYTPVCRRCKNEKARAWRARQPDVKLRAIQRRNKENRIKKYGLEAEARRLKRIRILRKYGITLEEYNRMLQTQGGKCAICKALESTQYRKVLAVDHNHKTKKVRALLCTHCNTGIAMFEDDWKLVRQAAAYLKHHEQGE